MEQLLEATPTLPEDNSLHITFLKKKTVMLGLHYVPGGHGSPGSPKRSVP